jgi:hypothetical protein
MLKFRNSKAGGVSGGIRSAENADGADLLSTAGEERADSEAAAAQTLPNS